MIERYGWCKQNPSDISTLDVLSASSVRLFACFIPPHDSWMTSGRKTRESFCLFYYVPLLYYILGHRGIYGIWYIAKKYSWCHLPVSSRPSLASWWPEREKREKYISCRAWLIEFGEHDFQVLQKNNKTAIFYFVLKLSFHSSSLSSFWFPTESVPSTLQAGKHILWTTKWSEIIVNHCNCSIINAKKKICFK